MGAEVFGTPKTYWLLHGCFISFPDKKETWCELESYNKPEDAFAATKKGSGNIIVRGFHTYRVIKRTCVDEIVSQ